MKFFLLIFIIPILCLGQDDLKDIKEVLFKQEFEWNQGNIKGFMLGYWNSDKLEFYSKNDTTYGWQNTYIKYQASYPTKDKMGRLQFKTTDMQLLSDTKALVHGKWLLIMDKDKSRGGEFILNFQKFNNDWLIIKDYTSSE